MHRFTTATALLLLANALAASPSTIVEAPTPAVSAQGTLMEDVGIETLGGVFTPLLNSGCQAPCSTTVVFSTADDRQPEIKVFLFRGKAKLAKEAKRLGTYVIREVPPLPRGEPQVAVTLTVQRESILLDAIDKQAKRPLPVSRVEP